MATVGHRRPTGRAVVTRPTWGGWRITFKIGAQVVHTKLAGKLDKQRMQALELSEKSKTFSIDINSYEYVDPALTTSCEGLEVRVYSLPMIVYEKLQALCQQMPGYEPVAHPSARPWDFVDICSILEHHEAEVLADKHLLAKVFKAKLVQGHSPCASVLPGDGATTNPSERRVTRHCEEL